MVVENMSCVLLMKTDKERLPMHTLQKINSFKQNKYICIVYVDMEQKTDFGREESVQLSIYLDERRIATGEVVVHCSYLS